ncbi:hypothetical protein ASPZODRAFT_130294 [Penicilliopsis zonata CBS 506.65]|uniref:Zn(2)-C6 fungal-type domain-containing protein n=1 Tax=Penicilliopsis zonata CBS 506.65 TaxID=1073090 RepID=A0A1L9SM64_9EURO|nr:hypothetical protein ASPZODRAFT_130294 [Penicilliopsis zonata CBS 506.65]OJJ48315.1 hypothetical protein ASPZODRAFT_130294 [Penicilliopsis zonata CBS 506.65]
MDEAASGRGPTACHPCAKAKVRCEPSGSGCVVCKRCMRLNKECTIQAPGAHKRKRARIPEIARLEEKLDGVAAILAASKRDSDDLPQTAQNTVPRGEWPLAPAGFGNSSFSDDNFYPDGDEAQLVLDAYRQTMMPYFPFVVIPPSITPLELRQGKPFLYRTIMMIACQRSSSDQLALSNLVRDYFIQTALVKGDQNLDLLQGLLVFLGWYHVHLQFRAQLSNPVHLLMGLVVDLGLNSPTDVRGTTGLPLHFLRTFYFETQNQRVRTLEERRTYLGCFHLIATISLCSRDMSPLKYTKYTDECCNALSEMKEYSTDEYIIYHIRLHRVGEKIRRTLWDDRFDITWNMSAPLGMCVRYLEIELQRFKDSIPFDMPQQALLHLYVHTLEISLYSIALSDNLSDGDYSECQMTRFNILHSCSIATKAFFDLISNFKPEMSIGMPYTCWSQSSQAVVVLSKLSLLKNEIWDEDNAQNMVDFTKEIDRMSSKIKALQSWDHGGKFRHFVPDLPLRIESRLQFMREIYEKKNFALAERKRNLVDSNIDLNLEYLPSMPMFDLLDGNFWHELF